MADTENSIHDMNSIHEEPSSDVRQNAPGETFRSILYAGKSRGIKKKVTFSQHVKEIIYFRKDCAKRARVSKRPMMDYKHRRSHKRRNRTAMWRNQVPTGINWNEGNELREWWTNPIVIELPPLPVEPGCNSLEKYRQEKRQEETLSTIYFCKSDIPLSPTEPDVEAHPRKKPKRIPFEECEFLRDIQDHSAHQIATLSTDANCFNQELRRSLPNSQLMASLSSAPLTPCLEESAQMPLYYTGNESVLNHNSLYMPYAPAVPSALSPHPVYGQPQFFYWSASGYIQQGHFYTPDPNVTPPHYLPYNQPYYNSSGAPLISPGAELVSGFQAGQFVSSQNHNVLAPSYGNSGMTVYPNADQLQPLVTGNIVNGI